MNNFTSVPIGTPVPIGHNKSQLPTGTCNPSSVSVFSYSYPYRPYRHYTWRLWR